MKIITTLVLFFCFSLSFSQVNSTDASDDLEIKNSIRVNGLGLISGFYEFQYERVIGSKGAIKVGFGTGNLVNRSGNKADKDFETAFGTNSFNNMNERIVKGFSANLDYRYFFTNKPIPKGLYVSPGIQYLSLSETYTYLNSDNEISNLIDVDYNLLNIRGMFGYQFIIAKSFVVNPYLGVGLALGNVENNNRRVDAFGTGFTLNLGIDIGVGF